MAPDLAAQVEAEPGGDLRYTGPLDVAREQVEQDRYVAAGPAVADDGTRIYEVLLCDGEPPTWDTAAEFGRAPAHDPETAWRYALGAYFAPEGSTP